MIIIRARLDISELSEKSVFQIHNYDLNTNAVENSDMGMNTASERCLYNCRCLSHYIFVCVTSTSVQFIIK